MGNGHEPATKQDLSELRIELKQDITELRAEMKQDITGLRAEMKQDITELRAEMKQDSAMVRSEMHHIHDALIERMADSETNLLKAFYSFAEANQARVTDTERESAALKERVGILERRLTDVERKVNFPNHPTQ